MHESWEDLGKTHHFLFLYILNSVAYGIQSISLVSCDQHLHTHTHKHTHTYTHTHTPVGVCMSMILP